jgi:hypothetical protein
LGEQNEDPGRVAIIKEAGMALHVMISTGKIRMLRFCDS